MGQVWSDFKNRAARLLWGYFCAARQRLTSIRALGRESAVYQQEAPITWCDLFWPKFSEENKEHPKTQHTRKRKHLTVPRICVFGCGRQNTPENATHPKTQILGTVRCLRFRVCCVFGCSLAPAKIWPEKNKICHIQWRPPALKTSTFGITWCDDFWPNLRLEVSEGFHIRWWMLAAQCRRLRDLRNTTCLPLVETCPSLHSSQKRLHTLNLFSEWISPKSTFQWHKFFFLELISRKLHHRYSFAIQRITW